MAFIDTDEFLHPSEGVDLRSLLEQYEEHAGLVGNWVMYGSSGHLRRPQGLQIEGFTRRTSDNYPPNTHVKSIMQLDRTVRVLSPHHFSPASAWQVVNERRQPITTPFSAFSANRLRINHYWTRSRSEFVDKINRGRSDGMASRIMDDLVNLDLACTVTDQGITRFGPGLRERLAAREPSFAHLPGPAPT
jgi:hypothetical protein